jgi:integrase
MLIKENGQSKKIPVYEAKSESEAREIRTDYLAQRRLQRKGILKVNNPITLKQLTDIYVINNSVENRQRKPSEKIDRLDKFFGLKRDARSITKTEVQQWRIWLKKIPLGNSTINKYVSFLSRSYTLAMDDNLIDFNPCQKIKKLEEVKENVRYLTKEEIELIKAVLEEDEYKKFKNLVYTALYTGFRVSNVNYMRWEWLDFKNNIIIVPATYSKSKIPIEHPINEDLYKIFTDIGIKKSGYVFPREETGKPYRNPSRDIINKIYNKAGLDVNGFHIIRHTVGTTLAENNAPDIEIQSYLHHEDYKTSRKYTHAKPKMLLNAANIISDFINS